jgi:hypothetical protein
MRCDNCTGGFGCQDTFRLRQGWQWRPALLGEVYRIGELRGGADPFSAECGRRQGYLQRAVSRWERWVIGGQVAGRDAQRRRGGNTHPGNPYGEDAAQPADRVSAEDSTVEQRGARIIHQPSPIIF